MDDTSEPVDEQQPEVPSGYTLGGRVLVSLAAFLLSALAVPIIGIALALGWPGDSNFMACSSCWNDFSVAWVLGLAILCLLLVGWVIPLTVRRSRWWVRWLPTMLGGFFFVLILQAAVRHYLAGP